MDKNEESMMITESYEESAYKLTGAVQCSQIVAYLSVDRSIKWTLLLLDGTIVYESSEYKWDSTWIFKLSELRLEEGTQLLLKANLKTVPDETSEVLLEYVEYSNTVYFEYRWMTGYDYYLRYHGYVPSATTPPVLRCSGATGYNDNLNIVKWALIKETGGTIYISDRYRSSKRWTLNFSDIDMPIGTRVLVKSVVIAGADSQAYILLEYDPTTTAIAKFTAEGSAIESMVMYKGTM